VFSNLLPGNDSFTAIRCSGNVISEPLLSNGRLLRLHHSGFQPSCHSTEQKKNTYRVLVEKPEGKIPLGRLNICWRIILKWMLEK
jgi:hypothetical protein